MDNPLNNLRNSDHAPKHAAETDVKLRPVSELVSTLTEQISRLISDQISLLKQEATAKATKIALALVLLILAGLFAIFLLFLLLLSASFGVAAGLNGAHGFGSIALGLLIVAGGLLVVSLLVIWLVLHLVKKSKENVVDPLNEFKDDAAAIRKGFER